MCLLICLQNQTYPRGGVDNQVAQVFGVKKTCYPQLLLHSNLWFINLVKYNNRVKNTPKNIFPFKWNFQKEIILRKCCNAFDSCYPNCQILYKCCGDFSLYKCNPPGLTLSELTLLYKCQHVFFLYKCQQVSCINASSFWFV